MILEMEEIISFLIRKRSNHFSFLFYTHAIGSGLENDGETWEGMVGSLRNTLEQNLIKIMKNENDNKKEI